MIYTVTFNPSLDYVVHMKTFTAGDINRAEQEMIYPGGKGINVSLVLGNLHIPSKMLGFVAGFTGREIERLAKINGGDTDFITLDEGCSRINLKVSADDETAVNGMGPHIPEEKLQALLAQIDTLKAGDTLVLAGSIPSDIPDDIYEQILKRLQDRDIRVVVDATGDLLKNVIKYRPFLIKPNNFELGELFSVDLHTDEKSSSAPNSSRPWGPATSSYLSAVTAPCSSAKTARSTAASPRKARWSTPSVPATAWSLGFWPVSKRPRATSRKP